MSTAPTGLGLLLCDADERAPVLAGGLPAEALDGAPAPERGPVGKDSLHLEALDRDPNDLAAQRWAVIAPEGEAGDAALAAVRALVEHRGQQQGAVPRVFRVPDRMDAAASLRWKNEVLRDEEVPADERPRYLLILGDIDRVSLELQHTLANGSFVGRLHCASTKGYRSYAEKVVARERAAAAPREALALLARGCDRCLRAGVVAHKCLERDGPVARAAWRSTRRARARRRRWSPGRLSGTPGQREIARRP